MNQDMYAFGMEPWEALLEGFNTGDSVSAVQLLTLLEDAPEEIFEELLAAIEEKELQIDLSELPVPSQEGETGLRLNREAQLVREGSLFQALEETDPLRLYLQELAGIPAAGDPELLAQAAAAGDEGAREMLVNLSLSRVVELACSLVGRGVLLLDLIQEGSMGLWQGILRYRQGDFAVYRDAWIRRSMAKLVLVYARQSGVGQKLRQAMEDFRSVDERLLTELGRSPTLEEMAQQLHMTAQQAAMVAQMLKNARNLNRARPEPETTEEDPEAELAVEDTAYFQARQRIGELLSALSQEDARLLSLRFGLEGGLPLSPEETGKRLGMTPEEVVSREAAALVKLRNEG